MSSPPVPRSTSTEQLGPPKSAGSKDSSAARELSSDTALEMSGASARRSSHESPPPLEARLAPLIVVVGPTGSGKTALSLELGEALNGEIVNADSVQIYEHFDIGSAKPTAAELARVRHHLVGTVDPHQEIEASRFAQLAQAAIADVQARGRTAIVCGGTFLWVRALLYGLADAPPGDVAVRERHRSFVQESGAAALHAQLADVDAVTAARLHENDVLRVSRALEVFELSGRKLSELHAEHGFATPRYRARLVGVQWERAAYEQQLERRAADMLARGLVEEVRDLLAHGYGDARAMQSVGYKQVRDALDAGRVHDQGELLLAIFRATKLFARRQRTWLREQPVDWLPSERLHEPGVLKAWLDDYARSR